MRTALAGLLVAFLATAPAEAFEAEVARADLEDVRARMAELERAIREDMPEATRTLAEIRKQTLGLTADLLEQRILAEEIGAEVSVSIPAMRPDPERAENLLAEIAAAEQELARLRREAAGKQGLPGALAQLTVLTQEQALAMLRLGYYQAQYGLAPLPVPKGEAAAAEAVTVEQGAVAPQAASRATPPAWADPRYPDIDYATPWFEALAKEGGEIRGIWSISSKRAALDDSLTVIAIAPDEPSPVMFQTPMALTAMCQEGQTVFVFAPGEYLLSIGGSGFEVEYRIGDQTPESGRWGVSASNKHVGFWGEEAIRFLKRLQGQERFFVRVTERNGSQHGAEFDIRGIDDVIAAVARACGWAGRGLSRDQLMTVQKALKQAGHYGGAIDGVWGANSRNALAAYQSENGLATTGTLNAETLRALGFPAQD